MALSKFIALFFALAVLAPTLQLSQARVQGLNTNQEEEQVSEAAAAAAAGGSGGFPGFPLPQIPGFQLPLPQIPGLPSFPFPPLPQIPGFPFPPLFGPRPGAPGAPAPPSSSSPPPAPPAECLTPLVGMATCMDYLTNITVAAPPGKCCDGLKSVIASAPICLCHGMNGGMSKLAPKPIDPVRMLILPARCGTMIPIQTLFMCATQPLPPLTPPASPAPPASPVSPAPPSPSSAAPASSPVSPP